MNRFGNENDEEILAADPKWLLVQRVLGSTGFRRADQLRRLLAYLTRRAILQPLEPVREHDIAIHALGRRNDFDPGTDNIVRVQTSHLRRKLDVFFNDPDCPEDTRIEIPRGNYTVAFCPNTKRQVQEEPTTARTNATATKVKPHETESIARVPSMPENNVGWLRPLLIGNGSLLFIFIVLIAMRWHTHPSEFAKSVEDNPLLRRLVDNHKPVNVVLPDASLMIIQTYLNQDTNVSSYLTKFLAGDISVSDPDLRKALQYLASKRTTTFGEASVAWSLAERLKQGGADVSMRYSRDLHVRDMGEANLVIIGSRRANPWTTLFVEKTNFRYMEDPRDHSYYFQNVTPLAGEPPKYLQDLERHDRMTTYVDIAMIPNLTDSGWVLLIDGADLQATEAGARFILSSSVHDRVKALFKDGAPKGYEILLRVTHILSESQDSLEVVAVRSSK